MKWLKQTHLQTFKFQAATSSAHTTVKDALHSFIRHTKSKLEKKYPDVEKYTDSHVKSVLSKTSSSSSQSGGRVSLPIDYFGVPGSTPMTKDLSSPFLVSNQDYLRPELDQTFEPILTGGGSKFSVSKTAFKEATQKHKLQLTKKGLDALKQAYEHKFSKVLEKVSKKYKSENTLHEEMLHSVLQQREFKMLNGKY